MGQRGTAVWCLTIHSSRTRFAGRLNSGVSALMSMYGWPTFLVVALSAALVGCAVEEAPSPVADPAVTYLAGLEGQLATCRALSSESPRNSQAVLDFAVRVVCGRHCSRLPVTRVLAASRSRSTVCACRGSQCARNPSRQRASGNLSHCSGVSRGCLAMRPIQSALGHPMIRGWRSGSVAA